MSYPTRIRAAIFVATILPLAAQVNVFTYQYDNTRAGQNLAESLLTLSRVNSKQFGKLFSYPVDGYLYAQPLYMPGVISPEKVRTMLVLRRNRT